MDIKFLTTGFLNLAIQICNIHYTKNKYVCFVAGEPTDFAVMRIKFQADTQLKVVFWSAERQAPLFLVMES